MRVRTRFRSAASVCCARRLGTAVLVRYDQSTQSLVRDARGRCVPCQPGQLGEILGQKNVETGDRASAAASGAAPAGPAAAASSPASGRASGPVLARDVFRPGDVYIRTGDLMYRDERGFYYFVDRVANSIGALTCERFRFSRHPVMRPEAHSRREHPPRARPPPPPPRPLRGLRLNRSVERRGHLDHDRHRSLAGLPGHCRRDGVRRAAARLGRPALHGGRCARTGRERRGRRTPRAPAAPAGSLVRGRASCAAVLCSPPGPLLVLPRLQGLVQHLQRALMSYAMPLFLRIRPSYVRRAWRARVGVAVPRCSQIPVAAPAHEGSNSITLADETLRYHNVDLAAEGADPSVVQDPLFVYDRIGQRYRPVTPRDYRSLLAGDARL